MLYPSSHPVVRPQAKQNMHAMTPFRSSEGSEELASRSSARRSKFVGAQILSLIAFYSIG